MPKKRLTYVRDNFKGATAEASEKTKKKVFMSLLKSRVMVMGMWRKMR